jgi:2-dehydro-3-deoxy-D-arabinonate dehydratase
MTDLHDLPAGPAIAVVEIDGARTLAAWDGGAFHDGSALGGSIDDVATADPAALQARFRRALDGPLLHAPASLLGPVGSQEVWAAGVTYRRSEEARMEESASAADAYARVYRAERPELFFKAPGWRVVGPGDDIGIRADSAWNVPEPELALLVAPDGAIRAVACANDVSSRSIEGENPLYLPQAQVYERSCALGPVAIPAWLVDPTSLGVHLAITRGGAVVFEGQTSVGEIVRPLETLTEHLVRAYALPAGAWLLTGTGIVPPSAFTLAPGDEVAVTIDGLGTLRNRVRTVGRVAPVG